MNSAQKGLIIGALIIYLLSSYSNLILSVAI